MSQLPRRDHNASKLHKAQKAYVIGLIEYDQGAQFLDPVIEPLNLVPLSITMQKAATCNRQFDSVIAVRAGQLRATLLQAGSQLIAVESHVIDQSPGSIHQWLPIQRQFAQVDYGRTGTEGLSRDWDSLDVVEDHDLGALAAHGRSHADAPCVLRGQRYRLPALRHNRSPSNCLNAEAFEATSQQKVPIRPTSTIRVSVRCRQV